ncbi:pyrroloquinoline quinone-dependent dehydrogenase [Propylenella binzhouense]|uniref:Pyrrolo-quinoline quinone n=1 Tax=Propylenella binzhouense TaxID=2555902 RepID=A0A964T138_9HYPH|nr:PQQ-binding-like beta-propeller repeat protein [Propylenella binzhouense]MYZ46481.1 pyrrolo-quinoline quinone [Propylenella binzhouense]
MIPFRLLASAMIVTPLLAAPLSSAQAQDGQMANPAEKMRPVTDDMLKKPDDGDWLMWRRTYNGWGYSPLDQINKENVKNLQLAWSWSLTSGATETTPLVHDGVLFIFNYGDKVQALNAATGDLIWEYRRDLPEDLVAAGGNNLAKRNIAIYQDKLIVATSDAHIIALDAKTGQLVWDNQTADWSKGWRYTGGPFVANGVIVQGMTGCGNAEPGGCFVTGNDPQSGKELWRVYTIARPDDPKGGDSWNGLPLDSRFGASAWISGSYDPDQNLVFQGVGQPYPWIAEMRGTRPHEEGHGHESLYSDSTLAIDPKTGELKWYHQYLEDDTWDLDYVYERILVDLPVNGADRKLLVTTGKLGIIEAIDRTNGEWLWATETVPQNVVSGIDSKTGKKTINEAAIPHIGQTTVNCPADPGGRGWPATAYSPKTQALYLPLNEFCSNTTPQPLDQGQVYTGGGRATFARVPVPNSDGNIGRVDAVKLTDQSTMWSHRQRSPMTSAVLPTGGGLVFGGSWDRWFRAFDDTTGDVLWQIRTNNAVNSFPITYEVDGKQYVAVAVGNGSSAARSWATLTPEITNPDGGSALWVFALPSQTQ